MSKEISDLLQRLSDSRFTEADHQQLQALLQDDAQKEAVVSAIQQLMVEKGDGDFDEQRFMPLLQQVLQADKPAAKVRELVGWKRWMAAAAVLLVLGSGIWYFIASNGKTTPSAPVAQGHDVPAPKQVKATITLSDGSVVSMDSLRTLTQANVQLVKTADGKIEYLQSIRKDSSRTIDSRELIYNTLSNPRGSPIVDMTLSDGSHVWLNAGSSITYPVAFTGTERKVSMTGEAYFEVRHDANKPFYVTKGDMEVKVLGTHFNVNAYDDEEEVRVTLLEGSVKVKSERSKVGKSGSNEVIIKPGEQARLSEIRDPIRVIRDIHVIRDIDPDEVIAWKQGQFFFSNTELPVILRQVARWYDIEINYKGRPGTDKLGGGISRDLPLSKMMELLEANGVKLKLEGRTLTIL